MIYLITPTGGRPDGIVLLGRYLNEQTYQGDATWLILDDCDPETPIPETRFNARVIRPEWRWAPGMNTQNQSMDRLLQEVPDDASVVILEDDDAYLPAHLDAMAEGLKDADLVGERNARYYNVATRRFKNMRGLQHSSLCATGCKGDALALLKRICSGGKERMIDLRLWKNYRGPKTLLDTANVVGIKGMPGRGGIGVGHRPTFGLPDRKGLLNEWIGQERATAYDRYRN